MAPDLTRREFLKALGILTSAGLMGPLVAREAAEAAPQLESRVLRGTVTVSLRINDQPRQLQVEPRTTLLSALRHYLNPPLTGTKLVCDRGSCGACTVLLDGRPVLACLTLAVEAEGCQLETIEGLGQPDKLHPIQQALVEHDGLQCGFCTPGFVMSLKGLLDHNPHPSDAEIQQACSGNFCRCGAYPKILQAARRVAGRG